MIENVKKDFGGNQRKLVEEMDYKEINMLEKVPSYQVQSGSSEAGTCPQHLSTKCRF